MQECISDPMAAGQRLSSDGTVAKVKPYNGTPTIFINDTPHCGMAYAAYGPNPQVYRDFTSVDVDLFSICATPTESGYNISPTAWTAPDTYDFSILDKRVSMILEANPRASRTVPLVSKVCNIRMVPLATDIITSELTGRPSPVPGLKDRKIPYYGVKEAVFPFNMFQEVDPILGPEMRSTGEVLGIAEKFGEAYYIAQEATQTKLPLEGTVLLSVNEKDKPEIVRIARDYLEAGFNLVATRKTYEKIHEAGIPVTRVKKLYEGRPNIMDMINNGQLQMIVNSPIGKNSIHDDSYLRKAAIKARIPYMTTMAAAHASASGIKAVKKNGSTPIHSLQEWHRMIPDGE